MKTIIFCAALFAISCGKKDEKVNSPHDFTSTPDAAGTITDEVQSADAETIEISYSGDYTIEGIPEEAYRNSELSLTISNHEEISYLKYAIGASCASVSGYADHKDLLTPIKLNLNNHHGRVQLCVKPVDKNGAEQESFDIYSWDQGYPELINKALTSRCRTRDDFIVSRRTEVEFVQKSPTEPLLVRMNRRSFFGSNCNGESFSDNYADAVSVTFNETYISLGVDGILLSFTVSRQDGLEFELSTGIEADIGSTWQIRDLPVAE